MTDRARPLYLIVALFAVLFAGCKVSIPNPVPRPPVVTPTPAPKPTPSPTPTPAPRPQCVDPGEALEAVVGARMTLDRAVDASVARVRRAKPEMFEEDRLAGFPVGDPSVVGPLQGAVTRPFFVALVEDLATVRVCALAWEDALAVQTIDGRWEEYHLVGHAEGRIGSAANTYKHTFRPTLPGDSTPPTPPPPPAEPKPAPTPGPAPDPSPVPAPGACPLVRDADHPIRVKVDLRTGGAGARWLDVTYEYFHGEGPGREPLGPCGRRWCDLGVDGGPFGVVCQDALAGAPTFEAIEGSLTLGPGFRDNANLAQVGGSGRARVCSSIAPVECAEVIVP